MSQTKNPGSLALLKFMTPGDFKDARRELGYTQSRLARAIGVADDRTIRRWEAGSRMISPTAILLVRIMLKFPAVKKWLDGATS